jgi:hypothetical protein
MTIAALSGGDNHHDAPTHHDATPPRYLPITRWWRPSRIDECPPPGRVPDGHPGLTSRVLEALAVARENPRATRRLTDDDGPHLHHWEPIMWVCRGCWAVEGDDL